MPQHPRKDPLCQVLAPVAIARDPDVEAVQARVMTVEQYAKRTHLARAYRFHQQFVASSVHYFYEDYGGSAETLQQEPPVFPQ